MDKFTVNTQATAEKIIRGDMPDPSTNRMDSLLILNDEVANMYMSLLATALFSNNLDNNVAEERINLFDDIMTVINTCRYGRLFKLIASLNSAIAKYETNQEIWLSAKFRRNVLSFVTDFWIWDEVERSSFLVIVQSDNAEELLQPATEDVTDITSEIKEDSKPVPEKVVSAKKRVSRAKEK